MEFDKSKYLAYVLSKKDKELLLSIIPTTYNNVYIHHVTLLYSGSQDDFEQVLITLGNKPKVQVIGLVDYDEVQCLLVEINGTVFRHDGARFHITYSISDNRKPVDSNRVIKQTFPKDWMVFSKAIELSGEILQLKK